jgi:hypothetical protein
LSELVRRIPKPFSVDITRHNKRLSALPHIISIFELLAGVRLVDMPSHRGVQGVRKGISKYLRKVLVDHARRHIVDHLLDER